MSSRAAAIFCGRWIWNRRAWVLMRKLQSNTRKPGVNTKVTKEKSQGHGEELFTFVTLSFSFVTFVLTQAHRRFCREMLFRESAGEEVWIRRSRDHGCIVSGESSGGKEDPQAFAFGPFHKLRPQARICSDSSGHDQGFYLELLSGIESLCDQVLHDCFLKGCDQIQCETIAMCQVVLDCGIFHGTQTVLTLRDRRLHRMALYKAQH